MDIVADIQEAGGKMTLEDLKSYQAHVRRPLITKIGDLKMYGIAPPASSATVAMMLKIMESIFNYKQNLNGQKKPLKINQDYFTIKWLRL